MCFCRQPLHPAIAHGLLLAPSPPPRCRESSNFDMLGLLFHVQHQLSTCKTVLSDLLPSHIVSSVLRRRTAGPVAPEQLTQQAPTNLAGGSTGGSSKLAADGMSLAAKVAHALAPCADLDDDACEPCATDTGSEAGSPSGVVARSRHASVYKVSSRRRSITMPCLRLTLMSGQVALPAGAAHQQRRTTCAGEPDAPATTPLVRMSSPDGTSQHCRAGTTPKPEQPAAAQHMGRIRADWLWSVTDRLATFADSPAKWRRPSSPGIRAVVTASNRGRAATPRSAGHSPLHSGELCKSIGSSATNPTPADNEDRVMATFHPSVTLFFSDIVRGAELEGGKGQPQRSCTRRAVIGAKGWLTLLRLKRQNPLLLTLRC